MEEYTPHPYQITAIKFLLQNATSGLFLDPGYGKSSIVLSAFNILQRQGMAKKMLVIAPLRPAYGVWPAEAAKWSAFSHLKVNVLHGPRKAELLREPHDVSVINPEGLEWLFLQMQDQSWWWDVLVVDESTKFKHHNTARFKILRPTLPKFKRRHILTGTPAPNGLLDLFGQIYLLDLGTALGRYVTHYRNSYFDQVGFGGFEYRLRDGAAETIYEKLRPKVLRMSGEQYLKLPPMVEAVTRVELPPKAMTLYLQMEAELIVAVKEAVISAPNVAAAANKCRQLAAGGIYHNTLPGQPSKWDNVHDAKTEAVQELVEELGGKPALIAYEFRHDLERLRKVFPDAPHLGGGVTPKRQAEIEAAWNGGFLPVLLAQPQSVAHGLNLQGVGAAVIWHSLTWDLELYDQLNRRIWRQGQKERVVVHRIVARETIDEVILRVLSGKSKTQTALLHALREGVR